MFCDGGVDFSSDGGEVVLKPFIESGAAFPNIHCTFAEVAFEDVIVFHGS